MKDHFDPFEEFEKENMENSQRQEKQPPKEKEEEQFHFQKIVELERAKIEEHLPLKTEEPPLKKKKEKSLTPFVVIVSITLVLVSFLNVFITQMLNKNHEKEMIAALEQKIQEIENSFQDQITYNSDLTSYYVAKQNLQSVLEITSTSERTGILQGSGFVITSDGYVLTNAHVVTYERTVGTGPNPLNRITVACEKVMVKFAGNKRTYSCQVVDFSTEYDLALLKFDTVPKDILVNTFADSVDLVYGEPCVAIGNARGRGISVTDGVVSNPMQTFNFGNGVYTPAIQHSAAINQGNSGGPLYNLFGQVIGINTFKLKTDEKVEGMGFAVPTSIIKDWINGLGIHGLKISYSETPSLDDVEN